MKMFWNKRSKLIGHHRSIMFMVFLALIMIAAASVPGTLAYFTAYATAKGGVPITLGAKTKVKEEFKNWEKSIQIENTGETDCYVRVKIIAASQFQITATGNHWTDGGDGYWYYSEVLPTGLVTEDELKASITVAKEVKTSFNVVIVQECIPVSYDENGEPTGVLQADWNQAKQVVQEEEMK